MGVEPRSLAVVLVIGLVLVGGYGLLSGGFGSPIGGGVDTPEPTQTPTPERGIQVRIGYSGEWQIHLHVTANGTTSDRSSFGNGNEVIEIDSNASRIRVSVQKQDDSPEALTLQVTHNGAIVGSDRTSEEYGTAQVTISF